MSYSQIPEAIQWHEGMLLVPQHFQQLARRSEGLLSYQLANLSPFFWGVRRCKIDQKLLVAGLFRIIELEAVMPDGLVVFYECDQQEEDLEISLQGLEPTPLMIHLAVPRLSAVATMGEFPRYQSVEGAPVCDESTGDLEVAIPRMKPRLRLLAGETPAGKFVSLPLAQVQYRDEGYSLTDFVPPATCVPKGSPLWRTCDFIARRVREKATTLLGRAYSSSSDHVALLLETRIQVQNLVAPLLGLEGILSTGQAHPFALFQALCLLAGHLGCLAANIAPPVAPAYYHNDLHATFSQLEQFVLESLKRGIPEDYLQAPCIFHAGIFSLKFAEEWRGQPLFLAVRGQAGMTEKDAIAWVQQCRIGSARRMQPMREKRILGAVREFCPSHDALLPPPGTVLFSLSNDPEFILPGEELQFINASDSTKDVRPAGIVLYVKQPPSTASAGKPREKGGF